MLRIAAWLIYREVSDEKVDQLDFTRSVVRYLFSLSPTYQRRMTGPKGTQIHLKLQLEHESVSSEKQGRCRYCKKNARIMCSGSRCFYIYTAWKNFIIIRSFSAIFHGFHNMLKSFIFFPLEHVSFDRILLIELQLKYCEWKFIYTVM